MGVDKQLIVTRRRGWPRPKPNPNEPPLERVLGLTGDVIALHLHVTHRMPMVPVTSVEGRRNGGLQGDSHVLRRNRAVTIVDRSTLDALGLRPGDLREQITVSGLPEITNLPRGTCVRAGGLVLRINGPCEPCAHIGKMLGVEDPESLRRRGGTWRGSVSLLDPRRQVVAGMADRSVWRGSESQGPPGTCCGAISAEGRSHDRDV